MGKRILLTVFMLIGTWIYSYSQNDHTSKKSLDNRITENQGLFMTDPEKAFANIEVLLKEAIRTKDTESELVLLSGRCFYYYIKMDIEKLMEATRVLNKQAVTYHNYLYQGVSHRYLAQAYASNELYDEAIQELDSAIYLLNKADPNNWRTQAAKINVYEVGSSIDLYHRKYPREALRKRFLAIKETNKITNSEIRNNIQSQNYSSLAITYTEINLDSSEYYVKKSKALKPDEENKTFSSFLNYIVMGKVHKEKKDYVKAIAYFKKAENYDTEKEFLPQLQVLFKDLYEVCELAGDTVEAHQYREKLTQIQLKLAQSRNNSLKKIIKENPKPEKKNSIIYISVSSVLIIVILLVSIILWFRKKNPDTIKPEPENFSSITDKANLEYIQKQTSILEEQSYNSLIEMLKNNEPAFRAAFHEKFPDFTDKLLAVSPQMAQTEIDFCALLKLNLSTKEIARFRNIQPKTVQNKKNRIKRKLNIPQDTDIYFWFSKL